MTGCGHRPRSDGTDEVCLACRLETLACPRCQGLGVDPEPFERGTKWGDLYTSCKECNGWCVAKQFRRSGNAHRWARAWKRAAKEWREAAHWRNNYAIVERDAARQEAERLKTEVARLESFFSAEGLRDERDRLREALRRMLAHHMTHTPSERDCVECENCRRALGEPTDG